MENRALDPSLIAEQFRRKFRGHENLVTFARLTNWLKFFDTQDLPLAEKMLKKLRIISMSELQSTMKARLSEALKKAKGMDLLLAAPIPTKRECSAQTIRDWFDDYLSDRNWDLVSTPTPYLHEYLKDNQRLVTSLAFNDFSEAFPDKPFTKLALFDDWAIRGSFIKKHAWPYIHHLKMLSKHVDVISTFGYMTNLSLKRFNDLKSEGVNVHVSRNISWNLINDLSKDFSLQEIRRMNEYAIYSEGRTYVDPSDILTVSDLSCTDSLVTLLLYETKKNGIRNERLVFHPRWGPNWGEKVATDFGPTDNNT